jgi:hypothetical protein
MTPFYQDAFATIYHGDAREILPAIGAVDSIITDPVWPNAKAAIVGRDRPEGLLREVLAVCPQSKRLILQLGCDSDPRILRAVPEVWPFFRVCWLEFACPTRKGRLLYTGDVAYVFGEPPASAPGRRVMPGRFMATIADVMRRKTEVHSEWDSAAPADSEDHPCPRRLQHLQYLVGKWSEGIVLDPFMGSGTTLVAAKQGGLKCIGIEIEERFCMVAVRRLRQEMLALNSNLTVAQPIDAA